MSFIHSYTCDSNNNRFIQASEILFSIDLLFQITIRFIGLKDKQTQQLIAEESNLQQVTCIRYISPTTWCTSTFTKVKLNIKSL